MATYIVRTVDGKMEIEAHGLCFQGAPGWVSFLDVADRPMVWVPCGRIEAISILQVTPVVETVA